MIAVNDLHRAVDLHPPRVEPGPGPGAVAKLIMATHRWSYECPPLCVHVRWPSLTAGANAISPHVREAAVRAVAATRTLRRHSTPSDRWRAFEWDWPAAEAAFRRASELDPSYSLVHLIRAHLLSQTGRHAEAEPLMLRARELDPLS